MKLIFSRKGFDAANGGYPSPILPSGEMVSLPIPESHPDWVEQPQRYQDVQAAGISLGNLVADLSKGRVQPDMPMHLDPDLDAHRVQRQPGWRPVFGQAGAAESHLQRMGVTTGDLFLFYGWFRHVEKVQGRFCYLRGAPDWHVLFGWLQIAQRLPAATEDAPAWAAAHPHCQRHKHPNPDSIYLAAETLSVPGVIQAGAGIFTHFNPLLRLTDPQHKQRSLWRLPAWFYPAGRHSHLSYHGRLDRWHLSDNSVRLQTVGRGQEFVLDSDDYPEVLAWLHMLFATCR